MCALLNSPKTEVENHPYTYGYKVYNIKYISYILLRQICLIFINLCTFLVCSVLVGSIVCVFLSTNDLAGSSQFLPKCHKTPNVSIIIRRWRRKKATKSVEVSKCTYSGLFETLFIFQKYFLDKNLIDQDPKKGLFLVLQFCDVLAL